MESLWTQNMLSCEFIEFPEPILDIIANNLLNYHIIIIITSKFR